MGAQVDQRGQNGMQTHPAGSKPSTQGWLSSSLRPAWPASRTASRRVDSGPSPGTATLLEALARSIHTDPSPLGEDVRHRRESARKRLEWSGAQEVGGELGPDLVDPGSTQPRGLALHELAQTCLSGAAAQDAVADARVEAHEATPRRRGNNAAVGAPSVAAPRQATSRSTRSHSTASGERARSAGAPRSASAPRRWSSPSGRSTADRGERRGPRAARTRVRRGAPEARGRDSGAWPGPPLRSHRRGVGR